MRWLMMAALATGLCAATAARAASPLDAPGPLDAPPAAKPPGMAQDTLGCSWAGGIGRPDIIQAYDRLVSWWGNTFTSEPVYGINNLLANPARLWTDNPLEIDPHPIGGWKYTWTYKGIAEKPGLGNLMFEQWTSLAHWLRWKYKWFEFDPQYVSEQTTNAGSSFALIVMMAHEFGHYVQNIGGRGAGADTLLPAGPDDRHVHDDREPHTMINRELDADRLAGAFVRSLRVNCSGIAYKVVLKGSDDSFTTPPEHPHGTSSQRFSCFMYGYANGAHPFFAGDPLGDDVIGNNERAGRVDVCPSMCGPDTIDPKTGRVVQSMMMEPNGTTTTHSSESCPSEPNKPEPKIGPPVATGGGASCVSNVFERWQNCACPPGLPVRDEIKGKGPDHDPQHDLIWCRRGKARM